MKRLAILAIISLLWISLFAQGIIFAWGSNGKGQANAPSGEDYIMVAAGAEFGIALRSNGSLVGWGDNSRGQRNVPSGNDFVAVSAGFDHAIALRSNGTIVAWGYNNEGQTNVPSGNDYVKIDAGTYHNLALKSDGTIVGWGRNSQGQLNIPAGTYKEIAAAEGFSAAIKTDGSLVAWGAGWNGETAVPTGSNYTKISAQYHHGLALRDDNVLVGWGVNWNNQLNIPTEVTFKSMSAGWHHSLAVTTDGVLRGWGLDGNLQSTPPTGSIGVEFGMVAAGLHYSIAQTGTSIIDTDGDGIPDDLDEYPEDELRAFNNYYPSPSGWGTLAFEDMWPQKGDYDFNDLVIDYRVNLVTDANNMIKDIKADMKLRAVGATYQNAFAIEFPFPISAIDGSVESYGNGVPYNMPLIEAGTNVILKVISNTNDFVSVPGHDVFWNTQPDQPAFDPIDISFSISLVEAFDPFTAPDWGMLNPYIMVNRVLGHEIHLPGYPPTIHADSSLFGLDDDTTDPAAGRYYKTATNLPWALDVPISWKYPIEKKQITHAYLAFKPWAESGGTQYMNWYELIPSQINVNHIYNP